MLAVRFDDGAVRLEDRPEPTGPDVRVRVRGCGICGSDLTILDARFPIAGTPGHEIAGELEDGTPVAIEPVVPCGSCAACRRGDVQICPQAAASVIGIGRDGGMAEFVRVPEHTIVRLPRALDPRNACLVEPLAVALHGLRRADFSGAEKALVLGGGSIGLSVIAAATSAGAEIDVVARHPAQQEGARRLGATVVDSGQGGDYDVVFDCAGTESAGLAACEALRPGGLLLMLAPSWDRIILPGMIAGAKELDLRISMMYGRAGAARDVDVAATLLGAREEIADVLIRDRFPLDRAPQAFARARERADGAVKVVLEP